MYLKLKEQTHFQRTAGLVEHQKMVCVAILETKVHPVMPRPGEGVGVARGSSRM